MKNLKTIAVALLVSISTITIAQTKKIDATKSVVAWLGKGVTHNQNGTISIKEGNLIFKAKKLKGGNVTIDMTSINALSTTPDKKAYLEGHLKKDEFFGTEKYPTATLVFKTIADKGNGIYTITADLTIKAATNPVTFDLLVVGKTAKTKVTFDRTKFDVSYGSATFSDKLGDKAIYDNIELEVTLAF